MAMNKNEKWQASQDFKRANDIVVKQETSDAIQDIALGHALIGNMSEFKMMMASLGKLTAQQNDSLVLQAIAAKLGIIKDSE